MVGLFVYSGFLVFALNGILTIGLIQRHKTIIQEQKALRRVMLRMRR